MPFVKTEREKEAILEIMFPENRHSLTSWRRLIWASPTKSLQTNINDKQNKFLSFSDWNPSLGPIATTGVKGFPNRVLRHLRNTDGLASPQNPEHIHEDASQESLTFSSNLSCLNTHSHPQVTTPGTVPSLTHGVTLSEESLTPTAFSPATSFQTLSNSSRPNAKATFSIKASLERLAVHMLPSAGLPEEFPSTSDRMLTTVDCLFSNALLLVAWRVS